MTRIFRDHFATSGLPALDQPGAGAEVLTAKGVRAQAAPTPTPARDGVTDDRGAAPSLFTPREGQAVEAPVVSGEALKTLNADVAEARLAHQFGRGKAKAAATALPGSQSFPGDPAWLRTALGEVGVSETKGPTATPRILDYFEATYQRRGEKGEHTDDSGKTNAWCAAFVTWSLKESGVKNGKAVGAREYEKWGEPSEPFRGAVVVLQHGKQKHVALLAGVDEAGNNVYLGGNQNNQVTARKLPGYTVLEIRKPKGFEIPEALKTLPKLVAPAATDTR